MGQKPKHGLGSSFGSRSVKRLQPRFWLGLQSVHCAEGLSSSLGTPLIFFVIWTSPRSATCYIGASKQSQRERASKMEVTTFCNLIIEGKSYCLCHIILVRKKSPGLAPIKEEKILGSHFRSYYYLPHPLQYQIHTF